VNRDDSGSDPYRAVIRQMLPKLLEDGIRRWQVKQAVDDRREQRRAYRKRLTIHPVANDNEPDWRCHWRDVPDARALGFDAKYRHGGSDRLSSSCNSRMSMRGRLKRIAEGGAS
jgi:hypothetical protein